MPASINFIIFLISFIFNIVISNPDLFSKHLFSGAKVVIYQLLTKYFWIKFHKIAICSVLFDKSQLQMVTICHVRGEN